MSDFIFLCTTENLDLYDKIWDVFSVYFFVALLINAFLIFYPKTKSWTYLKIGSYIVTGSVNILTAVVFRWYFAIPISIAITIAGYFIVNKTDVPECYKTAKKGGFSPLTYKQKRQIKEFELLPLSERQDYLDKLPAIKQMKIHLCPFVLLAALPAVVISIILKFIYNY